MFQVEVASCHNGRVRCLVRIHFRRKVRVSAGVANGFGNQDVSMQTVPFQAGKGGFSQTFPTDMSGSLLGSGGCVGGCTPQVYQMNQLLTMAQGLSSSQLLTLVQGLQERIRTQGRDMPVTSFSAVRCGRDQPSSFGGLGA